MKVNSISFFPSLSQSPLEITMPLGGMREGGVEEGEVGVGGEENVGGWVVKERG